MPQIPHAVPVPFPLGAQPLPIASAGKPLTCLLAARPHRVSLARSGLVVWTGLPTAKGVGGGGAYVALVNERTLTRRASTQDS
jgi:hypothetical protein